MTVARLREEMTQDEFIRWSRYFAVKQQTQELEAMKMQTKITAGR